MCMQRIMCELTWRDCRRCSDVGRTQVHRWAPSPGRPVYRKCWPLPSRPGARSVGAKSLCSCKSPEAKIRTMWEYRWPKMFYPQNNNSDPFSQPLDQHSSDLFFSQGVDPLEHPFTGELVGKVGLNLKCIFKNWLIKWILLCISVMLFVKICRFGAIFRRHLQSDWG